MSPFLKYCRKLPFLPFELNAQHRFCWLHFLFHKTCGSHFKLTSITSMHGMSNQRNLENNKKRNNKDRSEWGHLSVHMLHRELKVRGGGVCSWWGLAPYSLQIKDGDDGMSKIKFYTALLESLRKKDDSLCHLVNSSIWWCCQAYSTFEICHLPKMSNKSNFRRFKNTYMKNIIVNGFPRFL